MNKYVQHVYVIPEDDADRQLALGFTLHHEVNTARIQVMPEAGGWRNVLEIFQDEYVPVLRHNPRTHVVLLIDFDGEFRERRAVFEQAIAEEFKARVFVIGPQLTPERLKGELKKSFEDIGISLADDCRTDAIAYWGHEQLIHNEADRVRWVQIVKPFIFNLPAAAQA